MIRPFKADGGYLAVLVLECEIPVPARVVVPEIGHLARDPDVFEADLLFDNFFYTGGELGNCVYPGLEEVPERYLIFHREKYFG